MEELLELQQLLINGNIPGALLLVEEMTEKRLKVDMKLKN